MVQPLAELHRARAVGAVVFDGTLEAVDAVLKDLQIRSGIRIIFVKTTAGTRLRIIEEAQR